MYYIGADIHSSTCTFCVIDRDGKEIDNSKIATNGRLIKQYLREIEGSKKLTFEECELSAWMYGITKAEVDEIVVCNPVANRSYKKAKTDRIDARNLAKLLQGKFLTGVYHDGSTREKFRTLMSGYEDIINDAVRIKNRYKSLFRKAGEKVTKEKIYKDESFLEDLERPDFRFVGSQMYKQLGVLDETRKEYIKQIKIFSRNFKEIKYLMTIPGIGIIQAAKIVAQVVNPYRFKNKYKFYSYCGLARHKRISDGVNYGSEKIWGNRILKCVFKMAGHSALNSNNGLKKYYEYLRTKGVSEKNASNAVCRKISAIALSLWKKRQVYKDNILNNQITQ